VWRTAAPTLLVLLCAGQAAAQSLPRKVWNDVRWAAEDAFFTVTSPVRGDASGWKTVGWLTLGSGAALVVDDEVDRWIVENPASFVLDVVMEPFTEDAEVKLVDLGSGTLLVKVSGVFYLAGLILDSQDLRDAGMGCAVAEKVQSAIRHGVYDAISRERPLTADGDQYLWDIPGGDWEQHSFFGGHGANIMTCATFWTRRFDLSYAEPVIMGIALGVNFGRVVDRRHWLSDAIIGGAFGYAMGKAMADRQLSRRRERSADSPGEDRDGGLLSGLYVDRMGGAYILGWRASF
jgi:membrane-associated phospholipid phosphatase